MIDREDDFFAVTKAIWNAGLLGKLTAVLLWVMALLVSTAVIAEIMVWGYIGRMAVEQWSAQ
jgi:hypothetical protein